MKKLSIEQMENVNGAYCEGMLALAIHFSNNGEKNLSGIFFGAYFENCVTPFIR